MRLTFLKWYFYSIIKLKKLKIRKTMIDTVHYDNYPCGIDKLLETYGIANFSYITTAATNLDKVDCPECLKIISTTREDG